MSVEFVFLAQAIYHMTPLIFPVGIFGAFGKIEDWGWGWGGARLGRIQCLS